MGQRNEFGGTLGGHDPRDLRRNESITFCQGRVADRRARGFVQTNYRLRAGVPRRRLFTRNVDHGNAAVGCDVRELHRRGAL